MTSQETNRRVGGSASCPGRSRGRLQNCLVRRLLAEGAPGLGVVVEGVIEIK
jgi:hypothetical protein